MRAGPALLVGLVKERRVFGRKIFACPQHSPREKLFRAVYVSDGMVIFTVLKAGTVEHTRPLSVFEWV
ncbi:hypothetical protein C7374_11741 [Falsochrobactrum ovis]|jgi:hypothetical protein|uniref:Uncharacterized protein n=1 Tax=Falsochrobactrum ovis TaxID=1293442 RepID=A0A364JSD3_9HYPH|nr:hypothetical protein C7374_11741 [Falsochrobactrum ovis]